MNRVPPTSEALLPSSAAELQKLQARAVHGALIVLVLDATSVSLGLSVLAYFLEDLGGSAIALGSLFATFAVFNIASSAWTGYASDKLGRRPVLIASTVGVALGFLGTGCAGSVAWLFMARAWLGFWSGVGSTSRAYIADVTSPAKRTDAMGKASALMMVGYALGAPLGSLLALMGGYRVPFFVGAGASTLAAAFVSLHLPSPTVVQALMAEAEARAPAAAAASGKPSATAATATKVEGSAGGGLLPGAVPKLVLQCVYLVCTCLSQGFLMVAMPLFLQASPPHTLCPPLSSSSLCRSPPPHPPSPRLSPAPRPRSSARRPPSAGARPCTPRCSRRAPPPPSSR